MSDLEQHLALSAIEKLSELGYSAVYTGYWDYTGFPSVYFRAEGPKQFMWVKSPPANPIPATPEEGNPDEA